MTKQPQTLIVQQLPGIGDMIWHLPFIRAIARREGPVSLLTRPRSFAKQWLQHEPSISDIEYYEDKSFYSTASELRRRRFKKVWLFHDSARYASLALLAGIKNRLALPGNLWQRCLLTQPLSIQIDENLPHIQRVQNLLMCHKIDVQADDQDIAIPQNFKDDVDVLFQSCPRPWIALGVGASEDMKIWPSDRFVSLAQGLNDRFQGTYFVCGSQSQQNLTQSLTGAMVEKNIHAKSVHHLDLLHVFALLAQSQLFVGNDSSLMNAAACLKVPTFGLFGPTPSLNYRDNLYAIRPHGHQSQIMKNIDVSQVLNFILAKNIF